MKKMYFLKLSLLSVLFFLTAYAQPEEKFVAELDKVVKKTREVFNVPGISITIVKDTTVYLSKGYGVTNINTKTEVDEKTLFGIASNTKAFTAAGLAILVDGKKIQWDDKVKDYVPEFEMPDPYVTREFTIKDLLTHQSGLSSGYGDLMLWPASDFSREEIIKKIKFFKPSYGFRTKFGYSNINYIVAGEVIKAVTGKNWEDFTKEKIIDQLDMKSTRMGVSYLSGIINLAKPHVKLDGKLMEIEIENTDVMGPAGSIYSNSEDISKWMLTQLNKGTSPVTGKEIFSKARSNEMWTPVTVFRGKREGTFPSTFSGYALGWGVTDYNGNRIISHTGGLPGMVSKVTLVPEQNLGIAVFTNQQSGAAFQAITDYILEHFFNKAPEDHIETLRTKNNMRYNIAKSKINQAFRARNEDSEPSLDLVRYTGIYNDKWYGNVTIKLRDNKLILDFPRSEGLTGELVHFQYDTFTVKWENRIIDADCYVYFSLNEKGKVERMRLKPISSLTDFSYDFHDLDFKFQR